MKRHPYIMVVDENKEMLKVLNRTFELEGYGVTTATDGKSALELLDEHTARPGNSGHPDA